MLLLHLITLIAQCGDSQLVKGWQMHVESGAYDQGRLQEIGGKS